MVLRLLPHDGERSRVRCGRCRVRGLAATCAPSRRGAPSARRRQAELLLPTLVLAENVAKELVRAVDAFVEGCRSLRVRARGNVDKTVAQALGDAMDDVRAERAG